ncbi:MAG: glycosyltransferase family 4 protein [Nitrospinota bacterium]
MKSIFNIGIEEAKDSLKERSLDIAIIHLVLEGINSGGGGNATMIRSHIDAYPAIKDALARHNINITLYVAEIPIAKDHPSREPQDKANERIQKIKEMGGEFAYLADYTFGRPLGAVSQWSPQLGLVECWKYASASGSTAAINWVKNHDAGILFANDCMYAMSTIYASMAAMSLGLDLICCWTVHTTAFLHESPIPNPERLMVESAAIHWAKVYPNVRLGSISSFMEQHLIKEYGARKETIIPTGNGVELDIDLYKQRDQSYIKKQLKDHNIPTDRSLAFSWGRGVPYKRLDMLLKACKEIEGRVHPVIMTYPMDATLLQLKKELSIDASLIESFDQELMACLLQWERTEISAILSFGEPCGITPMEIRALAGNTGPILVVSDTGGLPEQVEDGIDGFITRQDNPEDIARKFLKILELPFEKKVLIRKKGYQTILNRYTCKGQIINTLSALIPYIRVIEEEIKI